MKRSFLLAAAFGLLASLAFTTPSQAGMITLVTTNVDYGSLIPPSTASLTTIDMTYTNASTITQLSSFNDGALYWNGTDFTPVVGTVALTAPDVVTLTFASPVTWFTGSFTFLSSTPYADSGSITVSPDQSINSVLSFNSAVPEPPAMALLGIGMTSFLAFRRFFKRWSIA